MDRKDAIRRYKEQPRPAGIFRVLHESSGRVLVGTSPDAPARLRRIQVQLEMGSHPNNSLQHDWDTDGPSGFEFEVLDVLPPSREIDADISDELETLLGLWTEKLDLDPTLIY